MSVPFVVKRDSFLWSIEHRKTEVTEMMASVSSVYSVGTSPMRRTFLCSYARQSVESKEMERVAIALHRQPPSGDDGYIVKLLFDPYDPLRKRGLDQQNKALLSSFPYVYLLRSRRGVLGWRSDQISHLQSRRSHVYSRLLTQE